MANRNMIKVNSALFNCLQEPLRAEHKVNVGNTKRWVETNPHEKKWLRQTVLKQDKDFSFSPQQHLCVALFDGISYLVCVGFKPEFQSDEFTLEEVNAGLFCALIDELKLRPQTSSDLSLELYQSVFYPVSADQVDGIGYALEVIGKFFPEICIYRIPEGSPLAEPETAIFRLGLNALTKTKSLLQLPWSDATLNSIRQACTTASDDFPFMLLAHAMLERKWEQAFLDAYRCIEFLFPFPKVNQLKKELQLIGSTIDISTSIEEILGWRQQEDIALKQLFEKIGDIQLSCFKTSLAIELPANAKLHEVVSNKIYKLRNECVHYRPLHIKSTAKVNVDWVALMNAMIEAVISLHNSEAVSDPE